MLVYVRLRAVFPKHVPLLLVTNAGQVSITVAIHARKIAERGKYATQAHARRSQRVLPRVKGAADGETAAPENVNVVFAEARQKLDKAR